MTTPTIDLSAYLIRFEHTATRPPHLTQQLHALRDALGIDPRYEPRVEGGLLWGHKLLIPGQTYAGHLALHGVKRRPGRELTTYHLLHSFALLDADGAIKGWSQDLEPRAPSAPKEVWFYADDLPLEMTDTLQATIKALIPKKPRAAKTP